MEGQVCLAFRDSQIVTQKGKNTENQPNWFGLVCLDTTSEHTVISIIFALFGKGTTDTRLRYSNTLVFGNNKLTDDVD